jgi:GNAT superfamily N-acetyltransferase
VNQKTICKVIMEPVTQPYQMNQPRAAPVLGLYHERINELLEEGGLLPRKQRNTAWTIYQIIRKEGHWTVKAVYTTMSANCVRSANARRCICPWSLMPVRMPRWIGMMALARREAMGWIDHLYLAPEVVGQGIGSAFVAQAKERLGAPVRLYTFQANQGARRFYERHGFRAIQFGDGSQNEERCPDVLYEWRG